MPGSPLRPLKHVWAWTRLAAYPHGTPSRPCPCGAGSTLEGQQPSFLVPPGKCPFPSAQKACPPPTPDHLGGHRVGVTARRVLRVSGDSSLKLHLLAREGPSPGLGPEPAMPVWWEGPGLRLPSRLGGGASPGPHRGLSPRLGRQDTVGLALVWGVDGAVPSVTPGREKRGADTCLLWLPPFPLSVLPAGPLQWRSWAFGKLTPRAPADSGLRLCFARPRTGHRRCWCCRVRRKRRQKPDAGLWSQGRDRREGLRACSKTHGVLESRKQAQEATGPCPCLSYSETFQRPEGQVETTPHPPWLLEPETLTSGCGRARVASG